MNWYIIGQIFGFVAVILGFISFQMKTSKNLLVAQTFTSLVFSLHYLLIGAFPAAVLNAVGIIRNSCNCIVCDRYFEIEKQVGKVISGNRKQMEENSYENYDKQYMGRFF